MTTLDDIRAIVKKFPGVTEDVKWESALCLCVGGKIFCMIDVDNPSALSLKVKDEEFDELCEREGFSPAPYVGRYKWVLIDDVSKISKKELEHFLRQSYEMKKAKLPKKVRMKLEKRD